MALRLGQCIARRGAASSIARKGLTRVDPAGGDEDALSLVGGAPPG